ncbi:hypothetical protein [Microvirga sp. M2]|uniref:hypothetical protein n=1 Tax=Microvirga sp. M2 TaxID=3073270 RepID=UPI0039C2A8CD
MDELIGVETIQGTAADDEIVIAGDQLGDARRIDGRGNVLRFADDHRHGRPNRH